MGGESKKGEQMRRRRGKQRRSKQESIEVCKADRTIKCLELD